MKKAIWVCVFILTVVLGSVTAMITACSSRSAPTLVRPTNTPIPGPPTATPTTTSTPCMVNGTPCTPTYSPTPTSSPTHTITPIPTNTPTITSTPTITYTPTVTATSTPTNSLSAFVTLGDATSFYSPTGIRYSNGALWVVDNGNDNLQKWATTGSSSSTPLATINSFNGSQNFDTPWGVGIDPAGNVYVADGSFGAVNIANMESEVFGSSGSYLNAFGNAQMGAGVTAYPDGVGANSLGTTVYVAGEGTSLVYVYSVTGPSPYTYAYQTSFGQAGSGVSVIQDVFNLFVDSSNNVWVADYGDAMAKEYGPSGNFIQAFTSADLARVTDVAVDGSGNVYVTDDTNNFVLKFNSSGTPVGQFGSGILFTPDGITLDGSGNIYVADTGDSRIVGFH